MMVFFRILLGWLCDLFIWRLWGFVSVGFRIVSYLLVCVEYLGYEYVREKEREREWGRFELIMIMRRNSFGVVFKFVVDFFGIICLFLMILCCLKVDWEYDWCGFGGGKLEIL